MTLGASTRLLLIGVLVSSAAGCLPIPHAHRRSPAIRGRVLDGGASVGGLTVKRVLTMHREDCVLDGDIAFTDAQGSFKFARRYEFRAVVPLYGDPIDPMVLCIYRDGQIVGSAESAMIGGAPSEMEVMCDLELLRVGGQERVCGPPEWMYQMRQKNHE